MIRMRKIILLISIALMLTSINVHAEKKCLLIMSYHKGYAWNDGIERGAEQTLKGQCKLKKFFMDTKRNTSIPYIQKKSRQAIKLISEYKPDIVIASDDNAAKYIITKYKDSNLPFVFGGINWTAEAYGFPYKNVTGMIEVSPIIPLLKIIKKNVENVSNAIYLSSDVITEHKDFKHYQKTYKRKGITLKGVFVNNMSQWVSAYKASQTADFIIVNNYAGIRDWNPALAKKTVRETSTTLTVTNYKWMMPYAMLALTKNAEEQGRWIAEVAIEVLSGTPISNIPITINKEWNLFINKDLLHKANIELDMTTQKRASTDW